MGNAGFRNPVAVHTRGEAVETLRDVLAGRPYVLVTSAGWVRRGLVERIGKACGDPAHMFAHVRENPTLEALAALAPDLSPLRGGGAVIVALGGGSVMDAAKSLAVALGDGGDVATVDACARTGAPLPVALVPVPIVCLPTTAGTGSEVTSTATLWDGATGAKYSLADARLYPEAAVLDPELTASAPPALTLAAGLDAFSHALESIWNVRHNALSDGLAMAAVTRIRRALPGAVRAPDMAARAELQTAALFAGLAISATRTALAHSISYPLTGRFGLRHGLACSFTLAEVAAYNVATRPDRIALIAEAFGAPSPEALPGALRVWLHGLGVYDEVRRVVAPSSVASLGLNVITPGRADNNVRPATAADAHAILYAALDEQAWSRVEAPTTTGRVIWITGLSGAGKTTLAARVAAALKAAGRTVVVLDGDDLRAAIAGKVGHSDAERRDLAQRYSRLCRFLSFQGVDVVCATMSLYHDVQEWSRANIPGYFEVYLRVEMPVLVRRDPKGLYRRALSGELRNVAGIDQPFEAPVRPDLVIDNSAERPSLEPLVAELLAALDRRREGSASCAE
ncbi:MAG: iron-containing alcohol dehydrogenase [Candidatus Rokubacteria bacterium]|nr:iron-containing alcohol dehydrogenase [Candidatus Rokubacteria bacterium]